MSETVRISCHRWFRWSRKQALYPRTIRDGVDVWSCRYGTVHVVQLICSDDMDNSGALLYHFARPSSPSSLTSRRLNIDCILTPKCSHSCTPRSAQYHYALKAGCQAGNGACVGLTNSHTSLGESSSSVTFTDRCLLLSFSA